MDKAKTSPFKIFVNQAGYRPEGKKTAVMNFPCESFRVVDGGGVCRYEGSTELFGYDKNSGDTVYRGDFSDFAEKGTYRIVSGNESSAEFRIAENVYEKVFGDVLKAFYYMRCGCGLEEKYAGVYKHGKCHTSPALLYEDKKTELDVSGGWHDAGDYGRYVTVGACAAAHLLYAYKMFPSAFEKRLDIPESGMPDILAECRYELEWLMKMQREDGGVYHKVTTEQHAPFVMPEDDSGQLYVFAVSSSATADCGAVCALAGGIYEKYDKSFSDRLRSTAEKACGWLERNPDFVGFKNPEDCNTGEYGERDDSSNRFWLYAEMYALTGDKTYCDKMKKALDDPFSLAAMGYAEMGGFGALAYLLCKYETEDALTECFAENFQNEAERLKNIADSCGYGCAMEDWEFYWGSNMVLLKHGMIFAVSDYFAKSFTYKKYAAAQLDYLLGVNPTGYSFVTGNGEFRCNYPHFRPAHADGIEECIPGFVSGGPNRFPSETEAKQLFPEGTPPMKCYADNVEFYSLNEVAIYWNSPAVFTLAYLCGGACR